MHLPTHEQLDANLRNCLLLKADDLFFTSTAPLGRELRNAFLGIDVEGLADENLTQEEVGSIDLSRFAITAKIFALHSMLTERRLSLTDKSTPETEEAQQDALEYLEYFLSTLPTVALGGLDLTHACNGAVRDLYKLAYAWLNLVQLIENGFEGDVESDLTVTDLALLSGLDIRTIRNRTGPQKLIRTSGERTSLSRRGADPALVRLHALDALDWLRSRRGFEITPIDPEWITSRARTACGDAGTLRGLIIAAVVNRGSLNALARELDTNANEIRNWFDRGSASEVETPARLSRLLSVRL